MKRVAVVGAGAAGLAAARTLAAAGVFVVVFERSKGFGGRIATRRVGPYTFDTGATSIAPRGLSIESVMLRELDHSDLVRVEKPIFVHQGLRVGTGDPAMNLMPRYAYRSGNTRLAKLLAAGLDVRLEHPVDEIARTANGYRVLAEDFDGIVLTPPIPQSNQLLWTIGETRSTANSSYRSCLSVLLGFDRPLPPQRYHALLDPEQHHPLVWLDIETEKCPGRAPEGHTAFVAQLNSPYSQTHWDDEDDELVSLVCSYLVRLYGAEFSSPSMFSVKRWKYSQPETIASFEAVNHPGATVVIASDGLLGGRVEQAFECGVRAARLLLDQP